MNTLLAKSLAITLIAAIAPAAAANPRNDSAASDPADLSADLASARWASGRSIEGVWEEQVSQLDCGNGSVLRSFRALNTFAGDGSLIAINSSPPALEAPALGSWWRASRQGDFGAKMKFFRFNPDGGFAGSQEVTRTIVLDPAGETLTGDITYQVLDANDQVLLNGCAHETGLRFR